MCQETLCVDGFVNLETAKKIMSRNFIGPDDISEHADIVLTPDDLEFFSKIPFSEKTLLKCQNSHILVAGLPASILWIYLNVPESRFHFDSDPWWFEETFASDNLMKRGWYLIRRNVLPDTTDVSYDDKVRKASEHGEEVPMGCELIFTMIFYYLVTGIRLFECVKTHCSDICINGIHFYVGFFKKGHIDVRGYGDPKLLTNVGIAGKRKPEFAL